MLFSPEFKTQGYRETPKLLVVSGDEVTCLEDRGGRIDRTGLLLPDVHTVECGSVLLHSWLRLEAESRAGSRAIEVSFNTVCRELYWEVAEGFRAGLYRGSAAPIVRERAKFDGWGHSNYGFMNLARSALIPGAEARSFFLQHRIATTRFKFLRRAIAPGCVAIVTQRELIVIYEGGGRADDAYGGRWTYMRLDRIRGVEIDRPEGQPYGKLKIILPGERVRQVLYEPERELVVRGFVQECQRFLDHQGPSGS